MIILAKPFRLFSWIFFISLVIFGNFFLINLTLAVIKVKYTDVNKAFEKTIKLN